ncbi:unnamed protein product [Cylicocyclus nassatus]|uniref:Cell division cycle protein 26 homolog n=1 Tax=Cylicocyclus nassatus TaxID=53992 RepID=A0AA36MCT9_CYLNA|nr:unnamed protein product [Cylicocyclus nassatus]CAJ0608389.1 unnamed protein product [Cylicocyclus nassatus]
MLRRPLTSIEIKADDIDHMEKVLLELYQKRDPSKTPMETDTNYTTPSTAISSEPKRPVSPTETLSSMDTSGNQTLPTFMSPGNSFTNEGSA